MIAAPASRAELLTLAVGATLGLVLLSRADRLVSSVVVGTGTLFAADVLQGRAPRLMALVVTGAGAGLLVAEIQPAGEVPSWLLALLTFGLLAWAWPQLATHVGNVTASLLAAGSWLGAYYTVPDTEEIRAVAVVVPVLATLTFLRSGARVTGLALVGLVVWATAEGGRGRPSAVVGGLACLGLLAVPVAVSRWAGSARTVRSNAAAAAIVVVQAGAVLFTSRVAGLRAGAAIAAALALAAAGAAVVLEAVVLRFAERSAR